MSTEPTDEQIEAFNDGWWDAHNAGRAGDRVRTGLRAVLALAPDPEAITLTEAERALAQTEALREAADALDRSDRGSKVSMWAISAALRERALWIEGGGKP